MRYSAIPASEVSRIIGAADRVVKAREARDLAWETGEDLDVPSMYLDSEITNLRERVADARRIAEAK